MRTALDDYVGGVTIGGESVSNLRYADDTTLLANTKEELQQLIERVRVASEEAGLFLNVKKTKVMVIGEDQNPGIVVGGEMIEVVEDFNFLGSVITNKGGSTKEVKIRLATARRAATDLQKIWKSHDISKGTKM